MTKYAKASVHPSELREFQDSQTGAHIYQLTNDTSINHNLYFLTSSFTLDQNTSSLPLIVQGNRTSSNWNSPMATLCS